jgi:hypothetical protein
MSERMLLPYEKGQDYIYISDVIAEKLSEHQDDEELCKIADKFRAYLGDKLDALDCHVFGIYNSDNYKKDWGKKCWTHDKGAKARQCLEELENKE